MIVVWLVVWFAFAIADTLFTLISFPLAPLIALAANAQGNLPKCLTWFQTFDASLDVGWQQDYFGTWSASDTVPTGVSLWWYRVRWLWRNPGYGFSYYAVGIAFEPANWRVLHYSVNGTNTTFIATDGRQFNIELGWSWLQVKIGWKAWNYFNPQTKSFNTTPWGPLMRTMICATIIPW
jgi:hypothetical protein